MPYFRKIFKPHQAIGNGGRRVGFFELGVDDVERGRALYQGLFGWRFEDGPSGQGFTISTPTIPGGIHAGDRGAAPYVCFRVQDMEPAVERVRKPGGVIDETDLEGDQEAIARFGRFKLCRDNQGSPAGCISGPARLHGYVPEPAEL